MANKNEDLKNAKKAKKDEFYTQKEDIEKELFHYKEYFKGKVIFCNCDDPFESNFFKYFALNFNFFGLKKLICTCYSSSPIIGEQLSLFDVNNVEAKAPSSKKAYKVELNEITETREDGTYDMDNVYEQLIKNKNNILTTLKGDGDFRSEECIKLLKKSDIVVTNPPFSLFREYVNQLIEYNKKFIIIGNVNALTYKEIFSLIKNNKLWLGISIHSGDREFRVPDDYPLNASGTRVENGKKFIRVKGVRWYTNLDFKERHEDLTLYKKFNEIDYPKYENFNAINVDFTSDIPEDYFEPMGVPITFMDKFNPDQFKIIALGIVGSCNFTSERKMEILDKTGNPTGKYTINAKGTLYRKFNSDKDKVPSFRDAITNELYESIYARIIIQRIDNVED